MADVKVEKLKDLSFAVCNVCGEENNFGVGFYKDLQSKPIWTCDECQHLARVVIKIDSFERSKIDKQARDIAGQVGGEYLSSLGISSFEELLEDQWTRFLDIVFRTKAKELRRLLSPICPPF